MCTLRTATILTREDTEYATITRGNFQNILKAYHKTVKEHKIKDLTQFPVPLLPPESSQYFSRLSEDLLHEIVQVIQIIKFRVNDIIYRERQAPDFVYFVIRGQVELSTLKTADGPKSSKRSDNLK